MLAPKPLQRILGNGIKVGVNQLPFGGHSYVKKTKNRPIADAYVKIRGQILTRKRDVKKLVI